MFLRPGGELGGPFAAFSWELETVLGNCTSHGDKVAILTMK